VFPGNGRSRCRLRHFQAQDDAPLLSLAGKHSGGLTIQQQLQMQRVSLDHYLSQVHQTRETFTANVHKAAENNTRARMALLQVAQQENLVPTDEEMTAKMQERADKLKKPLEEIMAKSNVESIRRNEAIRRAADWVIEHSTIEEK